MESSNVSIQIHSHDRNMAINKFVKETQFTTNQNYLWHAVKAVKQYVSKDRQTDRQTETDRQTDRQTEGYKL
jgi:hypothetical protein